VLVRFTINRRPVSFPSLPGLPANPAHEYGAATLMGRVDHLQPGFFQLFDVVPKISRISSGFLSDFLSGEFSVPNGHLQL